MNSSAAPELCSARFPVPQSSASLLLSLRLQQKTTLIIGGGTLAATRAFAALEADSRVVVATTPEGVSSEELRWRAEQKQIEIIHWDRQGEEASLKAYLEADANREVTLVLITDTLTSLQPTKRRTYDSAKSLYDICKSRGVWVNTTDWPGLCDFTILSTHRFALGGPGSLEAGGQLSQLQVGVTTNGQGCRVASRIRREIVARLPVDVGKAVERVGALRDFARTHDATNVVVGNGDSKADLEITAQNGASLAMEPNDEDDCSETPNAPVQQLTPQALSSESADAARTRRMKWVAQVSEYWSFERLAALEEAGMRDILTSPSTSMPGVPVSTALKKSAIDANVAIPREASQHELQTRRGEVFLLGSGPGHPSLLTLAAHKALTQQATLVLADKLVPGGVLALIPKHIKVVTARKFPGNAEGGQDEMYVLAREEVAKGGVVVRLKQGDPSIYGRFGEELLHFRSHDIPCTVIPGISSALAAPLFAGIPVTQRGVADSFVVCTGVGRGGKDVLLPGYERGRTLVLLMGVARLQRMITALTSPTSSSRNGNKEAYPSYLPIAVIERATMPDQRVLVSTLGDVVGAVERMGEQRPPGMCVIGWGVLALWGKGDCDVLGDAEEELVEDDQRSETLRNKDVARVARWLGPDADIGWRIWEGLDPVWDTFL